MNIKEDISEIIQLSKSKIGRDSAIVLAGNIFSAGLGFIATVFITRALGPAEFGLFSLALTVMSIASQFSDFGIGTGLVRFASLYLKNDKLKADLMFKVSLKIRLIAGILIFLAGFFASETLAVQVFRKPELIFPLKVAFTGTVGISLLGYITATLQARQSFVKFAFINVIQSLMKVTVIGFLSYAYKLDLPNALLAVIILPFIAFLIGSLIIPRDFLKAKGDEKESFRKLYHFSKWIFVSVFCFMIFDSLGVLMLGYWKSTTVVGHYSAAYMFAFAFPLITGTITTILLPKVSGLSKIEPIIEYIKKCLKFTIPIIVPLIILLFIAKPLIMIFYGVEYQPSVIIFQTLIIGFGLSILINPISLVIYSLNKPEILAYLNIAQLILTFLGNILLIPPYGAEGAAITTLLVRIIGAIFIGAFIYYIIRTKKSSDALWCILIV